jgi:excisionase family DNA binding protein
MEKERMLSVKDVAETLNISRSTVIRWLTEGKIKGLKFGRQWRFRTADISTWFEHGESDAPKQRHLSSENIMNDEVTKYNPEGRSKKNATAKDLLRFSGAWHGSKKEIDKIIKYVEESRTEAVF